MSASSAFDETLVLPRALEILAKDFPETTWATVPKNAELTEGWRSITYGDLGHAVDGFASWAQSKLGASDVVAYMGVQDIKYAIAEIGTIKTGRTILLPSPRNSPQESITLFDAAGCNTLIHSEFMDSQVTALESAIPTLKTYLIPSLDYLCREGSRAAYTGQYSVEEDAPAIVLQTSGSTGSPRPIRLTNGAISTFKHVSDFSLSAKFNNEPGTELPFGKTMFSMAPFFHESGTIFITRSILCRGPTVFAPSNRPATAELVLEVLCQTKPSIAALFPSVLEDIVQLPRGLDALAQLDMVSFGGAPLAQEIGDKISEVTFLYSGIGSTEAGVLATELPRDRKDWNYCAWAPISGVEMQPRDDGLFECVIKPVDRKYQRIFHTYPGITEYRTKDLFEEHATKKGLWKFKGRADDTIILSNGEKFNPVDVEKRMQLHPFVDGAIVVGQDAFQTGLLIEPAWGFIPPGKEATHIVEELWPIIEDVNRVVPKHAIFWKSKIVITSKDKPFVRTASKGNIIRSKSTSLYAAEIRAMYDNELPNGSGHLPPNSSPEMIESRLRSIARATGILMPVDTSNNQDLFELGMDSLQTLHLVSIIKTTLGRTVSATEVYQHPTIGSLAEFLAKKDQASSGALDRTRAMSDMIKKYTGNMTLRIKPQLAEDSQHGKCALLTGSTGNLGCLLLQELIKSPDVERIFCLNRTTDGQTRQSQEFVRRGLEIDFSRVTFLHSAGFDQPQLGLSSSIYEELLETVNVVIINAWTVDFNKTLPSFESLIAGTRNFVDLSATSRQRAHIVMISSVASVGNWASICEEPDCKVPERIIRDNRVPAPGGYGESKHVAALILAAAAEMGVTSTVIRVGQLAGAADEHSDIRWSDQEWIPNLIATSKALGVLPDQLGGLKGIDWVPIDLAARAIIEIAQAVPDSKEEPHVLHIVNPKTATWSDLVPAVESCLERALDESVPVVPYATWLSKLREIPNTRSNAERVPGIKLLGFYESLAASQADLRLVTGNAVLASPTMAELGPISAPLMVKWVEGMY